MDNKKKPDKRTKMIMVIITVIAFVVGLFALATIASYYKSSFLEKLALPEKQFSIVADLINAVIAAIAAALVILQLKENEKENKRENDIQEASFFLQLNQSFLRDPNLAAVESLLENQMFHGKTGSILDDANRQQFVNYLAYFDGVSQLVRSGVLRLDYIDDLMAYRFFLAVNNKEVQDEELLQFPGDYRGCFKLYKIWAKYRKSEHKKIHFQENALDKWEHFEEYANESLLDSIILRQLDNATILTEKQLLNISDLIYETDPIIHAKLFKPADSDSEAGAKYNGRQIISGLLTRKDEADNSRSILNCDNLFVCFYEQEIIGIIHWITGVRAWNYEAFCRAAVGMGVELDRGSIHEVYEEYFEKCYNETQCPGGTIALLNICVI